jgi:hypothetical protein
MDHGPVDRAVGQIIRSDEVGLFLGADTKCMTNTTSTRNAPRVQAEQTSIDSGQAKAAPKAEKKDLHVEVGGGVALLSSEYITNVEKSLSVAPLGQLGFRVDTYRGSLDGLPLTLSPFVRFDAAAIAGKAESIGKGGRGSSQRYRATVGIQGELALSPTSKFSAIGAVGLNAEHTRERFARPYNGGESTILDRQLGVGFSLEGGMKYHVSDRFALSGAVAVAAKKNVVGNLSAAAEGGGGYSDPYTKNDRPISFTPVIRGEFSF